MPNGQTSLRGAGILGIGGYRPHRVVGNEDLAARTGRTAEWITRRTGIVEGRYASAEETVADMAVEAVSKAAADAGVSTRELDAVIVASMSRIRHSPGVAPEVAYRLGSHGAAFDLNAACAGYCYGLGLAALMVRSGTVRYAAVVGSDKMTDIIDPNNPSTAPLFADGAGAMVIGPREHNEIGPGVWGSDGGRRDLIRHTATWREYRDSPNVPWPTMDMAGPEVFRWVVETMPDVAEQALAAAGIGAAELDVFVPHQANLRIIDRLAKSINLPDSVAVARDVVTAGNTSTASIPLAVTRLREAGTAPSGGRALFLSFGAGLTWAGLVARLP